MKNFFVKNWFRVYNEIIEEYCEGRYGYGAIGIIGQSCLGSVAIIQIFMNNDIARFGQMVEVFVVTILCMFFNGSVLAQLRPKIQVNILMVSVAFSILIIILNLS